MTALIGVTAAWGRELSQGPSPQAWPQAAKQRLTLRLGMHDSEHVMVTFIMRWAGHPVEMRFAHLHNNNIFTSPIEHQAPRKIVVIAWRCS